MQRLIPFLRPLRIFSPAVQTIGKLCGVPTRPIIQISAGGQKASSTSLPLSTTTKSQPEIPLVLPKCVGQRQSVKSRMGIAVDNDRSSILGEDEVLESTEVNQGEENQDMNRDTQLSNVPAIPSMDVGDTDDLSSSNPDSLHFRPPQISTPHVARSLGRQRQAREPSQFVEMTQMMTAREDAERDRENRCQQEQEECKERYRRKHEREQEEREENTDASVRRQRIIVSRGWRDKCNNIWK